MFQKTIQLWFVKHGWLTMVILWLTGCEDSRRSLPIGSAAVAEQETSQVLQSVDLGIIDYERGGYVCVPLNELGIDDTEEIVVINTSCESTSTKLIEFRESEKRIATALRLDIAGEPLESSNPLVEQWITGASTELGVDEYVPSCQQLAIKVALRLGGGESRESGVRFVQSPFCMRRNWVKLGSAKCHIQPVFVLRGAVPSSTRSLMDPSEPNATRIHIG